MRNRFYRNTRLLVLLLCLILVWGFFSFQALPRLEDPALSQWYGKITTRFPGASAERVESLVTDKLEQKLQEIEEIKFIESTSQLGTSFILIRLQDTVKNHDEIWSRVRDRLADVTPQLPPEVIAPNLEDINDGRGYTLISALTWELDSTPNYAILKRIAKELKNQLYKVGSIEEIEFWGAPSEEILVEINPTNLTALGLTPQQLSQQIHFSDAKVSSGRLYSRQNNLLIEIESELDSLERIRQIPIGIGKNLERLVRLGDIASVKKTTQEPPSELAIINGKPGIALGVLIEPNRRIDRWMKEAQQTLEAFRGSISPGIGLEIILDQNHYVKTRLNNLFKNLLFGGLLVVATATFLMGGKSALVIASALPLSVLIVFGEMKMFQIPLHQVSLIGLIIALGILIDNAVVVVDRIESLLKKGLPNHKAISQGIRYLAIPLLASTLTTMLMFVPIALIPGDVGEYVRTISLSVILALGSSLLLSLTVIPAIQGQINKKEVSHSQNFSWWKVGFSNSRLTRFYRHILSSILAAPVLGILLALILPITGFLMADSIPEQFFPPAERDQFQIELQLSSSASFEQTQSVVETATDLIRQHSEVIDLHWFFGTDPPSFYYTVSRIGIKGEIPYYATAMVQISSSSSSRQLIKTLQKQLNQAIPAAQVLVKQLEQSVPIPPIELRIYGPDLDLLRELGSQVRSLLVRVPNVTHTRTSLREVLPKLALSLDEEQVQLTGLNNTEIAQQLNANLEGIIGGSILEYTEELPVRVRLSNSDRANLDQINTLDLVSNNRLSGDNLSSVSLSAFSQINLVPETAIITRRNSQRVNTIQGFITAGTLPSEILADFQQRLSDSNFQLPPGYSLEWGGESAERNEAVGNLLSTVSILVVLMVAILILCFNSLRSAGIICLVAIGSVGLALFSLWFFGYPLGFMAVLGTVGLVGVAINDSIMILTAIRKDPQAKKGDRLAMVNVIINSTRHVLTTTITTIAGFIPLLLDGGELWPPLAICIAGGVGGATLLALFFVPCVYSILMAQNHTHFRKLFNN